MFYVVKIPTIRGFQEKTCIYDIVLEYETHNLDSAITDPLDMEELSDIIACEDDGYIIDNYELTEDNMSNYDDAQWQSAIRIPLSEIKIDDIYPASNWNYFTSV